MLPDHRTILGLAVPAHVEGEPSLWTVAVFAALMIVVVPLAIAAFTT